MKVRALIQELTNFDMDLPVEIIVDGNELDDFGIVESGIHHRYLHFELDANGMKLINERDLEDMQDKVDSIEDLENRIKELENEVDLLESRLNE